MKREDFVPDKYKHMANIDAPIPIGHGATISQPSLVKQMCNLLQIDSNSKVLDIGTGSGYQAALLAEKCKEVVTIERVYELYIEAKKRLERLGYTNIKVIHGDGSKGYKKEAPYDGIIVAATSDGITKEWKEQLKEGGRIIYPEYRDGNEVLVEGIKKNNDIVKIDHGYVRFVPLVKEGE
ncbi:MAG: Protein-L-isoaspartate O-methyltransferase [candidate division WS6 bacterium 34_10]|uniref:Protein-L-isoaspartate O-methyltransferase n=1 Tax=candidate division WS6 bacterium 34_10 TaxID=1641389 RepID=A0A124FXB6_9BACT|nr:MAG: Protein-L-isoaspartate O-methyltransferase [candidate division WS6 bacterium 34_10]